jgi:hypothetical protein
MKRIMRAFSGFYGSFLEDGPHNGKLTVSTRNGSQWPGCNPTELEI